MMLQVLKKAKKKVLVTIDGSQYGYLRFRLPRFEEYIRNRRNMY